MPSARSLEVRRRRCLDRCLRPAAHMRAAQAAQKTWVACSPHKDDRWQRSSLHQLELCRAALSGCSDAIEQQLPCPACCRCRRPLAECAPFDPFPQGGSRLAGIAERGAVGTFVFGKSSTLLSVHHFASSNAAPPPDSLGLCLPSPLLQSSGSAAGGPAAHPAERRRSWRACLNPDACGQILTASSGSGPRCRRRWADRRRRGCSGWTAPQHSSAQFLA